MQVIITFLDGKRYLDDVIDIQECSYLKGFTQFVCENSDGVTELYQLIVPSKDIISLEIMSDDY